MMAWWIQWFSPEQLLLINFDELRENPVGVVQKIVNFSGVDLEVDEKLLRTMMGGQKRGRCGQNESTVGAQGFHYSSWWVTAKCSGP